MTLDRASMLLLIAAAFLSLASSCNLFVAGEGEEEPAWRDEGAEQQMEDAQMDEVEERIER